MNNVNFICILVMFVMSCCQFLKLFGFMVVGVMVLGFVVCISMLFIEVVVSGNNSVMDVGYWLVMDIQFIVFKGYGKDLNLIILFCFFWLRILM